MLSEKVMIIHLIAGLIKNISYKMSYFPFILETKFELNFSNYATKSEVGKGTDVDPSEFVEKADLVSFKINADKLDIDKLKTVPIYLIMLCSVRVNGVVTY